MILLFLRTGWRLTYYERRFFGGFLLSDNLNFHSRPVLERKRAILGQEGWDCEIEGLGIRVLRNLRRRRERHACCAHMGIDVGSIWGIWRSPN